MRERLPNIKIKPDVAPSEFLTRLRNLDLPLDVWKIGGFYEGTSEEYISLQLDYIGDEPGIPNVLTAWLICAAEYDEDRVLVEMKTPGGIATYDTYVNAAVLLKPSLRLYNQTHGARVRLGIESREQLEPKLPPKARKFFDGFVNLANKGALHHLDWQRFYIFVRTAHRVRLRLHEVDISYLLVREGFDEESARHIADIYEHGRGILGWPQDPTALREHKAWVARTWAAAERLNK